MRRQLIVIVLFVVTVLVSGIQPSTGAHAGPTGKMYWTDDGTNSIRRANLEIPAGESASTRTDVDDLVTAGLVGPTGLALDVVGGKMYWTDRGTLKIQRANLEIPAGETASTRTDVDDLVTTGLIEPAGIALDVAGGRMYWTDFGTDNIQRGNLDGSTVEALVTTGLVQPFNIALHTPSVGVGGIAELPEVAGTPLETGTSSDTNAGVLAGMAAAAAAGVIVLGGAAWWARTKTNPEG